MIKVSNLSKTYAGDPVFTNVSFVLDKPQVVGLIGDNGAGKTTLIKILSKEIQNYEGIVKIENENWGYMPQEPAFEDSTLVGEFMLKRVLENEKYKFESALRKLGYNSFDE